MNIILRAITCAVVAFGVLAASGDAKKELTINDINLSKKTAQKYKTKPHHSKLSLDCMFCHQGQGKNADDFEAPEEEVCLECHKSKEYLADRLKFMDTLKANPHNSVHDGPNLYCDECHHEHEKSENMCFECHEKEIKENLWMKETP